MSMCLLPKTGRRLIVRCPSPPLYTCALSHMHTSVPSPPAAGPAGSSSPRPSEEEEEWAPSSPASPSRVLAAAMPQATSIHARELSPASATPTCLPECAAEPSGAAAWAHPAWPPTTSSARMSAAGLDRSLDSFAVRVSEAGSEEALSSEEALGSEGGLVEDAVDAEGMPSPPASQLLEEEVGGVPSPRASHLLGEEEEGVMSPPASHLPEEEEAEGIPSPPTSQMLEEDEEGVPSSPVQPADLCAESPVHRERATQPLDAPSARTQLLPLLATGAWVRSKHHIRHPTLCTLLPRTLHPAPCTTHPAPDTPHPPPLTLHPAP